MRSPRVRNPWAVIAWLLAASVAHAQAPDATPSDTAGDTTQEPTQGPTGGTAVGDEDGAATTSREEPEGYRELIADALREYDAKNFEESRALFLRAHALFPNARTLRGIGMVEFERRNYLASIAHLEAALASSTRPLDEELRAETEALLARAETFVGLVNVRVRPASARVLVDGELVPSSATGEARVRLQAGEHVIDVHAAAHVHESRTVSVRGADEQVIAFALTPVEAPARAPVADTEKRSWWRRPWLWAGLGVVTAVAVSVGVAMATRDTHTRTEVEPPRTSGDTVVTEIALEAGR